MTGLYYYRFRYYSPNLQRFISEDPFGLVKGTDNLYVYVRNNPVNFVDPFGLYSWDEGTIKINDVEVSDSQVGEYFSTVFSNFHSFKKSVQFYQL